MEIHPVPVKAPWYHLGIDFVGPVAPTSPSGNSIFSLSVIISLSGQRPSYTRQKCAGNRSSSFQGIKISVTSAPLQVVIHVYHTVFLVETI